MAERPGRALAPIAIAAIAAALLVPAAKAAEPAAKIGAPAPALGMADLDGAKLDLAALRGKVVVVDFWATWCAPCRSQAPRWVALQEKYRRDGLEVIGVSLDESAEPVRAFRKEFRLNYRVGLGDAKVAERWGGVLGLPVAFVIDRKGRLAARHEGEDDLSAVEKDVVRLLREK
ncbi:MAG: TlpA disulfide reductase family protein [Thermoanaerobaculia bacterium]